MPLWVWWTIAVVLFASGGLVAAWGLFGDRSKKRRCLRCGYDMAGVPGLHCPECGREVRGEAGLVGTRRRWGRVRIGAAAAVVGVAMGVHLWVDSIKGGWWRAAPTSMLLNIAEQSDNHAVQMGLWARVSSGDPRDTLGVRRRLSDRHWGELAAICGRIIADPARSLQTRSWATVTLGCVIPDTDLVDPIFEQLLRSEDEEVRRVALGGAYPYYLERGHLSDRWFDELLALASRREGSDSALMAAGILARTWPLRVRELQGVFEAVGQRGDAAEAYGRIAESLAAGAAMGRQGHSIEGHLALLREMEHYGPDAAAAAQTAMSQLRERRLVPETTQEDASEPDHP